MGIIKKLLRKWKEERLEAEVIKAEVKERRRNGEDVAFNRYKKGYIVQGDFLAKHPRATLMGCLLGYAISFCNVEYSEYMADRFSQIAEKYF